MIPQGEDVTGANGAGMFSPRPDEALSPLAPALLRDNLHREWCRHPHGFEMAWARRRRAFVHGYVRTPSR